MGVQIDRTIQELCGCINRPCSGSQFAHLAVSARTASETLW